MAIAAPSMSCYITPPGGTSINYTAYLAYSGTGQSMTITQNFGRQGDTATIVLVDEHYGTPHFHIPAMSQIALVDNNLSTTVFSGVVDDPTLVVTGATRNEWVLQCLDNTIYANKIIAQGVYNGWTIDDIVVDITSRAKCGITAATIADGGYVAPAPSVSTLVLNWQNLTASWKQLAQLASQTTPYGWYVDKNLELHFYDASTALNSGVTFTTLPTVGGSATEAHILRDSTFAYEWDGTQLFNRILVQGANQTIFSDVSGSPTDTWVGDGVTSAWPLRYTLTGEPTLKIGTKTTDVTVVQAGYAAPTTGWSVQQNSIGQWFLTSSTPPGSGVKVRFWYDYQVPVVAQASDQASIAAFPGPNGGVFAEFQSNPSLTTAPMALAWAQQERQEYAFPVERMTWNTSDDWLGWIRAGYTCQIHNTLVPDAENSYALGVNDTFIITANTVTWTDQGYRNMQLTAVRL